MTDRMTREPLSMGAEISPIDVRDYHLACTAKEFPAQFQLDTVPVKDQGSMPTCTAHASSLMVEYFNMKQEGGFKEFSTKYIFGRRDSGKDGKGMALRDALKILQKYGDCLVEDCRGNAQYSEARADLEHAGLKHLDSFAYPHRISTYYRCNTIEEVKTALMEHGYVIINMPTYSYRIINDVYTPTTKTIKGYHAVIIYGWDDNKGWLIQNSWGDKWASDGRFILPFDYPIVEYWGASDNIINENIKKPCTITKVLSRVTNLIANLLRKVR